MSTTKQFVSRRLLLLQNPLHHSPISAAPPALPDSSLESPYSANNKFDANVVMVLSVLLCALICCLGINSIIRCAFRCWSSAANNNNSSSSRSSGSNSTSSSANTGIKKKALKTFPIVNYSVDLKLPGLDTECVICLSEFAAGEKVRLLPKCNHGFHVKCIDKWLSTHSSCPKCRHCLIETCHKIVGSNSTSSLTIPLPLEPEALIGNYREISISLPLESEDLCVASTNVC